MVPSLFEGIIFIITFVMFVVVEWPNTEAVADRLLDPISWGRRNEVDPDSKNPYVFKIMSPVCGIKIQRGRSVLQSRMKE